MKVHLYNRNEVESIDETQWQRLAQKSVCKNPFYEPYALIPALHHLEKTTEVLVVAAYDNAQLIALFPIELVSRQLGIKVISIWKHNHCFLSDPLCSHPQYLAEVIAQVCRELRASIWRVNQYSPTAFGLEFHQRAHHYESRRGFITDTHKTEAEVERLPRKVRSENQRIINRIQKKLGAEYKTSADIPDLPWFQLFSELEHRGWKSDVGGSILSKSSVTNYYKSLVETTLAQGVIEFQGIFVKNKPLAIAFRLISGDEAYEIKTAYDESYRKYYPGVVLEILNLRHLRYSNYSKVDSCTSADNSLVNRLWPERRLVLSSVYFKKNWLGRWLSLGYWIKRTAFK